MDVSLGKAMRRLVGAQASWRFRSLAAGRGRFFSPLLLAAEEEDRSDIARAHHHDGGKLQFPDFGSSAHLNLLLRGNPFGASRPASARLPRQSASSLRVSEKVRSDASFQVSPSAALKVFTSDKPPSL